MAAHSSLLAWRIPWTEEAGGLQSTGSQESDTTEQLTLPFTFLANYSHHAACYILQTYLTTRSLYLLTAFAHFNGDYQALRPQIWPRGDNQPLDQINQNLLHPRATWGWCYLPTEVGCSLVNQFSIYKTKSFKNCTHLWQNICIYA